MKSGLKREKKFILKFEINIILSYLWSELEILIDMWELLTIFVIYKAFSKGTVFLSSLYVVNTGVGTWILAVGMWKTLEAALCQVISPRICFTFWQSMTCQV